MKITVIGTGHVGLVWGTCLAEVGNDAAHFGTIQFIAVGTPPDEDGSAEMKYVTAAARNIGRYMTSYKLVVDKSTVPVGTADAVRAAINEELALRGVQPPFSVVSNPEFLKEGAAIDDFMKPDRIVLGCDNEQAALNMRALYASLVDHLERSGRLRVKPFDAAACAEALQDDLSPDKPRSSRQRYRLPTENGDIKGINRTASGKKQANSSRSCASC